MKSHEQLKCFLLFCSSINYVKYRHHHYDEQKLHKYEVSGPIHDWTYVNPRVHTSVVICILKQHATTHLTNQDGSGHGRLKKSYNKITIHFKQNPQKVTGFAVHLLRVPTIKKYKKTGKA